MQRRGQVEEARRQQTRVRVEVGARQLVGARRLAAHRERVHELKGGVQAHTLSSRVVAYESIIVERLHLAHEERVDTLQHAAAAHTLAPILAAHVLHQPAQQRHTQHIILATHTHTNIEFV